MKQFVLIFFLMFTKAVLGCECPTLSAITKESCASYDVIFSGNVDSVAECDTKGLSIAYFTVLELYKGNIQQQVKVNFDCSSECLMSFAKGETWLIYGKYKRFDLLTVNICGHNRKFFADEAQDFYMMTAQRTFEQEKQFLKETFGTREFISNETQTTPATGLLSRNEQPSGTNKLFLLLISFVVMAIVFLVTQNKNKKNGK